VRLWVASQDYRSDIVVSEERVNKVGETYRAIRNALRYQLSNLYDFDPTKHSVADDKLTGLDRWILGEFSKLEKEVIEFYDKYEFHVVYQKVSQFIAVELSAIYHDVIKDRLYTDPANSLRRRSTQTALLRLVTGLCQMLAPILSFTTDEAWEFVPGVVGSVHEGKWKSFSFEVSDKEKTDWKNFFALREQVLPELEAARQNKLIGKSLEAKVALVVTDGFEVASSAREDLRELFNVSRLALEPMKIGSEQKLCMVTHADGQKCERCWRWELDVGQNPEHPTICGRCAEAVKQFQVENSKAK
jgi:isoleucyl-tRNA synthetase